MQRLSACEAYVLIEKEDGTYYLWRTGSSTEIIPGDFHDNTETPLSMKPGDYLYFGRYDQEPILWQIININDAGELFLWSDKILTFKAFGTIDDSNPEGVYKWEKSSLRQWLNSADKKVNYTGNPPTDKYVNKNPYADEPGFLHDFTKEELDMIRSKRTEAQLTDRVFLMSIEEISLYGISNYDRGKNITESCEKKYERSFVDLYWTRTYQLDDVVTKWPGKVSAANYLEYAKEGTIGVCPALFIRLDPSLIAAGSGSLMHPFRLLNSNDTVIAPYNDTPLYAKRINELSDDTLAERLNILGVFKGTNNGYELDREPTRLEGLVMLIRLLGKEDEAVSFGGKSSVFVDVPDWGVPYANYAYENGLTKGIGDQKFGSQMKLTKEDYSTFILRALGYEEKIDFSYKDSFAFLQSLIPDLVGKNTFLRQDIVSMSCKALVQNKKNSDSLLIESLRNSGDISNDKYARFFGLSRSLQVYNNINDQRKLKFTIENNLLYAEATLPQDYDEFVVFIREKPYVLEKFIVNQKNKIIDLASLDRKEIQSFMISIRNGREDINLDLKFALIEENYYFEDEIQHISNLWE